MPSHYEEEKQDDPIETLQSPPSSFQMKGFPKIAGTSPKIGRKAKEIKIGRKAKEITHGYKVEGEEGHQAFRSDLSFPEAFRSARDAGVDTFMWQGEPFTTKIK